MIITCPVCSTADFIKVTEVEPARAEQTFIRTAQGSIPRMEYTDAVVTFFCQKCGYFNGRSVPAEWARPDDPALEQLRAFGEWYIAPGTRFNPSAGGSATTVGR